MKQPLDYVVEPDDIKPRPINGILIVGAFIAGLFIGLII